jgi:predicted dehydrogenase
MIDKHVQISRRSFLRNCAVVAAATGLPLWFVERNPASAQTLTKPVAANDRPGIALIGCGGMGRNDAENASQFGDLIAVCDVDDHHADEAAKQFSKDGKTPAKYADFRKLLERREVHAVINATPDHWHTLVNLAAARAGKDVYAEKPLTLTIDEGRRVVTAVRKHQIVLQTGSQQRSDKRFHLACELVRNGRLGKLKQITVWLPPGSRGGPFAASAVPPGLNWDFWLGQAPKVDYVRERCHGSFRYWYDYSGGTMTDWGAHHNDIARWAVGLDGPVTVEGRPLVQPIPGGYTAFSEYEVNFTYANGVRQTTTTTRADRIFDTIADKNKQVCGVKFEGGEGWIWVSRAALEASNDELLNTPLPENAVRLYTSQDHMGNFFDCVRSRKAPVCEAEIGHRSATMCHLGVIALRLGGELRWNPAREKFTGENAREANQWLAREMRRPYDYGFIG